MSIDMLFFDIRPKDEYNFVPQLQNEAGGYSRRERIRLWIVSKNNSSRSKVIEFFILWCINLLYINNFFYTLFQVVRDKPVNLSGLISACLKLKVSFISGGWSILL
jgi:hypothetical protein